MSSKVVCMYSKMFFGYHCMRNSMREKGGRGGDPSSLLFSIWSGKVVVPQSRTVQYTEQPETSTYITYMA